MLKLLSIFRELDQDNRHRHAISAFAYLPLSDIIPEYAESFSNRVEAWIDEQKKSAQLAPGLAEQLDIQLKILKDKNVPDVEFISFSGYLSFVSKFPRTFSLYDGWFR